MQTPVYKVSDNVQVRVVKAVADDQGNLSAEINTSYSGLQQDFPHSLMHQASKEEREEYLNSMFNLPTYQVVKSNYTEHKDIIPSVHEYLQIILNSYVTKTGKRLFIAPNLFGGGIEKLLPDTARLYDYVVKDPYRDIDSIEIKIPAGYKTESIPKDISLQNKFGKYISTVKVMDDKIVYFRHMEQYSGRFAAVEYNDLVLFYQQISKADRSRVVLVKSD